MAKTQFPEETPSFTPVLAMEEASRCLLCLDAPCSKMCPAGTDPAKFIRSIRFKNVKGAAKTIHDNNPLGAICARVCPTEHYCQKGCSRSGIDKPIDIARLQRFATDMEEAFKMRVEKPSLSKGKKIAVVGSGPAGLSAAATLAKLGYEVIVFEKEWKAGGCLRFGIPEYRLPERVLDHEISRIESLGVKISLFSPVSDVEELRKHYDAVVVADGFGLGKTLPLFEGNKRVVTALEFLKKAKKGRIKPYGHVLIVGGGDVAMDVATTCKKLGVPQVSDVVYETFDEFKASKAELELARKHNVSIYDGFVPVSTGRGGIVAFKHRKNEIDLKLKADLIVLAIGQTRAEGGLGEPKDHVNVFYAGDIVEGDKTVVYAVKTGKEAAKRVDAYLGGEAR